jgi:hypothetical protein
MGDSRVEYKERLAGSRVRIGPNGKVMRVKTGGWQWSEEAEEVFFDHLAATCNVTAAAAAVGFTTPTVYRLRRMRPEFAARWPVALEQGYAKLEMALLQAANDSLEGVVFDDSRAIPKMTVEQAMNVLRAHRNEVSGSERRGPGAHARRRTLDEVRDSILRKVEAIRRAGEPDLPVMGSPPAEREGLGESVSASDALSSQALPQPLPQAGGEKEQQVLS